MKKKILEILSVFLCAVLLSTTLFSASVSAAKTQEKETSKADVEEKIEYADQDEFLSKIEWLIANEKSVETLQKVFPDAKEEDFLAAGNAGLATGKSYAPQIYMYNYLLQEYEDATFEDAYLNTLAHEIINTLKSIVAADEFASDSYHANYRYYSEVLLVYFDLYELADKFELDCSEKAINNFKIISQELSEPLEEAVILLDPHKQDSSSAESAEKKTSQKSASDDQNPVSSNNSTSTNNSVAVVDEFIYSQTYYVKYLSIIKNNTKQDLDVTVKVTMLDENGEPLSFQTEEILTLGPGCSFPAEFSYDKDEIGETYKVEMESTRSEALSSASPDLSYEMKKVKKGAIINVTNNGKKTAVFVNGIAVFFKDGKPVYSAPGIFLDAEDHIQPGDTVTNQINCSDEFDDVKFYLQGCYY